MFFKPFFGINGIQSVCGMTAVLFHFNKKLLVFFLITERRAFPSRADTLADEVLQLRVGSYHSLPLSEESPEQKKSPPLKQDTLLS